jgi:hypothetical protein
MYNRREKTMSKADEAADFFEKIMSGNTKWVDADENSKLNDYENAVDSNDNGAYSREFEQSYKAFIDNNKNKGYGHISREEYMVIYQTLNSMKKGNN